MSQENIDILNARCAVEEIRKIFLKEKLRADLEAGRREFERENN